MKRGLDWYKRDPRAFLDGVQGMGPDLIGAYAVLLDLMYARGGETRRDDHHLAGVMGCSKRKAKALTDELISRGKITVEGDFITNSVAKTTANSRRTLSEDRANAGRKGGEKSGQSRKNKDLPEASASTSNEAEEEKRREEKNTPLTPQGGQRDLLDEGQKERGPPPKASRGSRLPDDWQLPRALGTWAVEQGLSEFEVRKEAETFKDYWIAQPGAKGRKADWSATWRNWIRRKLDDRKGGMPAQPRRKSILDQIRAEEDEAARGGR